MSKLRVLWGLLQLKLPAPLLRLLIGRRLRNVDGRQADPHAQLVGEIAQMVRGDTLPTIGESRAQLSAMAGRFDHPCPADVICRDITRPGAVGPRPARVYTPKALAETPDLPTLLYLHGGGWVQGGIDTHDGLCGRLALWSGFRVISFDYGLAPEHKFPAASDDVLACYTALTSGETEFDLHPDRMAVGGDSAGANLTAALMHDLAEAKTVSPRAQLLIYPALDGRLSTPSMQTLRDGFLLPRDRIDWYMDMYLPEGHDLTDPRFSPALSPHKRGLPATLIIAGGHDPLRDEALQHAQALTQAGIETVTIELPGQIHAFMSLSKVIPEATTATRAAADWLARALD